MCKSDRFDVLILVFLLSIVIIGALLTARYIEYADKIETPEEPVMIELITEVK